MIISEVLIISEILNLSTHQYLFKINSGYPFNKYNAAIINEHLESELPALRSFSIPIRTNTNFMPFDPVSCVSYL